MPNIFDITDKSGRKIRLTDEAWKHISKEHPDLGSLEEIKEALINPLIIKQSKYDPETVRWYYRYNKEKRRYLFVAVKYLNREGFVITAYFMRNIK